MDINLHGIIGTLNEFGERHGNVVLHVGEPFVDALTSWGLRMCRTPRGTSMVVIDACGRETNKNKKRVTREDCLAYL